MSLVDLAAAPISDFETVTSRTRNNAFREFYHALRENAAGSLKSLKLRVSDPPIDQPSAAGKYSDRRTDTRPVPAPDGNPFQPNSMRTPGYSIFYRANDRNRTDWRGLALSAAGLSGFVSIYKIPNVYVQRAGLDYSYEAFIRPTDPSFLVGYARIV